MALTSRWLLTAALVGAAPLALSADTLYLRNGQRIEGDLISVRGTTIEFQDRRGNVRTIRIDRAEVSRIEFEDSNFGGGGAGRWGVPGQYDRPSGTRERQINVSATVPWTDTGIDLSPGQTISIQASGEVRWGRDRRDGPEGERNSPFNQARPLPNRPGAALIGRVGADVFYIGAGNGPIRMRSGGRLQLGINDEFLDDNSGSFRVTVFY